MSDGVLETELSPQLSESTEELLADVDYYDSANKAKHKLHKPEVDEDLADLVRTETELLRG
jgi:hypothetical protein